MSFSEFQTRFKHEAYRHYSCVVHRRKHEEGKCGYLHSLKRFTEMDFETKEQMVGTFIDYVLPKETC